MENAGAVFFRETLLLLDPATASLPERKRAAEVIAHELAHMWYGDLVTMAWWDDLWLNEAFATWMAYRVVDDWKPEWRMWQDFEHDRAGALALDALASTHPIYAPGAQRRGGDRELRLDHLREGRRGRAHARALPRRRRASATACGATCERHREGNAVAADLWRALGEASGADVARVAQAWIEQPGFPLRDARRAPGARCASARSASSPIPRVAAGEAPRSAGRCRWSFASAAREPATGRRVRWSQSASQTRRRLPLAAAGVVLRQRRRRRLLPRAARRRDAGGARSAPSARSTPVERLALAGDQWALVRADRAAIDSFLDLADALGERDRPRRARRRRGGARRRRRAGGRARPARSRRRSAPGSHDASVRRCARSAGQRAADEPDEVAAPARGAAPPRRRGRRRRRTSWPRRAAASTRYLADRGALEPNLADAVVVARRPRRRRRALRALSRGRCRRADAAGAAPLSPEPRVLPDSGDGASARSTRC